MKPEDLLNAIGEVEDAYIQKAHRKSLLYAILTFVVISAVLCVIAVSQMSDDFILLRFNTDFSVNTGFIEPEVLIHDKWTSLEQTTYVNGVPVSTTEFKHTLYDNYAVTHSHNEEVTRIVGTSNSPISPKDYLGSKHYANLYIRSQNSIDLIDRIETIAIYSETAYGDSNQELNCTKLEYFEHSDWIHRQTRLKNGHTMEEAVIGSRGYDYQNGRISGWKEWDAEGTLLSYAEYTYDGNNQTVSTYLADGTYMGTRLSQYVFGHLKWREHYDASGELVSKEVYHYRVWELFASLEGFLSLVIILSLAATVGIGIWDDRIQIGARVVSKSVNSQSEEVENLTREVNELNRKISELSEKMMLTGSGTYVEELKLLAEQLKVLNSHLEKFSNFGPENEQRR